jgi:hypothetical protein
MVAAADVTGPAQHQVGPAQHQVPELPDGFWYGAKRRLLGPPLVTEQLAGQRLSKPLALGVLSCDGLSSAAYGTEEILYALLPFFGLAAFTLVLPMTLLVLFGVALVVLSYREVVSVYTRAGGSYVVARENFGPRVAQVAAVALLIDYVVTVAVQTAAGSAAIVSAFPALSRIPVIGPKILLVISVLAILLMCLGNLRGIREAGRIFALPTYLFAVSVIAMIVAGVARELAGGLPHVRTGPGTVSIGSHSGLIPFYAIGVFTGFAMAGFGMARYHRRTREPGWRRRLVINTAGGIYTALVVVLFAVVKFTEGAWLIVILFRALVYLLIRLNREYRHEAAILDNLHGGDLPPHTPNFSRRSVLVLVDGYDLATIAALKYAKSLRPTSLRAVHFSLDSARADKLRQQWLEAGPGVPLELADCPDRRLAHAAARLAAAEASTPGTHVTVVLPRRSYPVLAGRLLHDHTADRIVRVVSRVPSAAATIIPFDVRHKVETLHAKRTRAVKTDSLRDYEWPVPPPGTDPIGSLRQPGQATVEGRLRASQLRPVQQNNVLACEVADSTGDLTAVFYGRTQIAGLEPGRRVRLHGMVGIGGDGHPAMINPACEPLPSPE